MRLLKEYIALAVLMIGIGTFVATRTSVATAFNPANPRWSDTIIGFVYGNGTPNRDGSATYLVANQQNTEGIFMTLSGCALHNGQQVAYQQDPRAEMYPNQLRLIAPSNCHLIVPTE